MASVQVQQRWPVDLHRDVDIRVAELREGGDRGMNRTEFTLRALEAALASGVALSEDGVVSAGEDPGNEPGPPRASVGEGSSVLEGAPRAPGESPLAPSAAPPAPVFEGGGDGPLRGAEVDGPPPVSRAQAFRNRGRPA